MKLKVRPLPPLTDEQIEALYPDIKRRLMTLEEIFETFGPDALLPPEKSKTKRAKTAETI